MDTREDLRVLCRHVLDARLCGGDLIELSGCGCAAFDRNAQSAAVFTVAYVVRAVSPGSYVLPQAYVEDMYRPDRYGRTGTGRIEIAAAR